MILRKLEVYGFKSFADRQVFSFAPGITAVIGPNGCGKSNVVDAFKWVLGEQAPSSIRSKGMSDVLYLDREGKEAVSYAEGSITFDNTAGALNFDAPEVVVTRRIHNDGRSDYLINNTGVRLRTLRDLFMGTGIGTRSYFVLEQGRITDIIKRSPIERRVIFEEAAGIGRYNQRRREAERKLASVEDSLNRVRDVVTEITRQIRSLRIQAGRARSYNEGSARLREIRILAGTIRYHDIHEELGVLAGRLSHMENEEVQALTAEEKAARLRKSSQNLRQRALEAVHRYRSVLQENEARVSGWRERIQDEKTRAVESRREAEEKTVEAGRFESGLEERRAEMDALNRRLEEAATARKVFASLRTSKTEELEDATTAVLDLDRSLEALRRESLEKDRDRARLSNRLGTVRVRRGNLEGSLDRLSRRSQDLKAQLARISTDRQSAEVRSENVTSTLAEARETLLGARSDLKAAREHLEHLDGGIAEARIELRERQGRLEILKTLEASREGMGEGARFLLEEAQPQGPESEVSAVLGLLGDHLDVAPAHARAVERALGKDVEALLTRNLDGALEAAETLEQRGKGGATFWPVDREVQDLAGAEDPGIDPGIDTVLDLPGVVGWAPDLVRERGQSTGGIRALLRDVILVQDRDAALRLLAEGWTDTFRLVTLAGEIFGPLNRVVAGESVQGGGLISRRVEVQRVEKEIETLEVTVVELEEERQLASKTLAERVEAEALAQEQLQQQDLERVRRTKEVDDLCRREMDLEEEVKVGEDEAALMNEDLDRIKEEARRLEEETGSLEERLAEIKRQTSWLETLRAGSASRLDAMKTEVERVESACVGAIRRETELGNILHQILERISEMEHGRSRLTTEARCLRDRAARSDEETGILEGKIQETVDTQVRWKNLLRQAEGELDASESHLEAALRDEEEARKVLEKVRSAREEDRIRQGELRTRLESLVERLASEEDIDIVAVAQEKGNPPGRSNQDATGSEAPEDSAEDSAEDPAAPDLAELDEEAIRLKRKLDRLGPVNAQAITELEELEKRDAFYREQERDLTQSQKALEDIIRRINRRSRQIFLETFNTIRAEFRSIFRKLFGGGRGDIRLLDEDNVLESGVEIVAQPPEKGAKSIDMLSGGEKVMTTTALLFAIFTAKPCPFCLLDEIDAALDEANIQRFLDLLEGFLSRTQFIIVTHNKRTIAEADVIHGITMPKAGRSRRVSVKFEDGEVRTKDRTTPVFALETPDVPV